MAGRGNPSGLKKARCVKKEMHKGESKRKAREICKVHLK
jgi:hypothetical protein